MEAGGPGLHRRFEVSLGCMRTKKKKEGWEGRRGRGREKQRWKEIETEREGGKEERQNKGRGRGQTVLVPIS